MADYSFLMGYHSADMYVIAAEKGRIVFVNDSARAVAGEGYAGRDVESMLGEEIARAAALAEAESSVRVAENCGFFDEACRLEIYPGEPTLLIFIRQEKEPAERWVDPKLRRLADSIREPLSLLSQAIELMNRQSPAEGAESRCEEMMVKSCFQLIRIVDNVSGLDNLRSEDPGFEPRMGEIVAFCRELVERAEPVFAALNIPIKFESCDPIQLPFDRELIERALYNLLSNSAGYTREGNSVTVRLSATKTHCLLSVADRGRGIPDGMITGIFSADAVPESGAAGFGIALVRAVASLHGGGMALETKEGDGTTVTLSLSLASRGGYSLYEPKSFYQISGGFPRILLEMCGLLSSGDFNKLRRGEL